MCAHAQRTELEASVLSGTSIRATAKLFNVSWSALQRHLQHLPAAVAKSAEEEALHIEACGKLPARIEELIAQIRHILKAARKKQDFNAALGAIRANLSCLEMLGKISGELRPSGAGEFVPGTVANARVQINLPSSPQKDPERLNRLLREIYNLADPLNKPDHIM